MLKKDKYQLETNQLMTAYKQMLLIRRFEEKCGQFYGMGLIGGFCHLYIGQEAVATAINMAKGADDSMVTSYRDHGHILLVGTDPKEVMAELTGRGGGCSGGKGGSMHLFNKPKKFYGGHGIVGAQVPIGTGIAFAEKYNGTDNSCWTFLGDGAVNQGQVYEAFNMAALWGLPAIYVIENNEYSMGTSVHRSTAMRELYRKGESFGIKGIQVDGMDVREVYNAAMQAADYVKTNKQPIIIECKTYRYRGHSMSDPAKYRSKEEVEVYKEQDPISLLHDVLIKNGHASEAKIKEIAAEIKALVAEAAEYATNAPLPDEAELYTDIYRN